MSVETPPFVILGCGYVGTRLAQSLLADKVRVRVCARRVALLESLQALGAEAHYLDASRPHQFGPALHGLDQPVVVYAIPGVAELPQGEGVRRAATAAQKAHARAFIYLGSSAVYGRSASRINDEWIDEESSVAAGDPEAGLRLADEAAVQSVAQSGLRAVILRLAAIYGPAVSPHHKARGVRQRLRGGNYKLWDGGRYYFSRIHVDDLVRMIRTAAERIVQNPLATLYVAGDDHPCPQLEYATWLSRHLNLPLPPSADPHLRSGAGNALRGHRLRNDRIKRELDLKLLYPSFREGEAQIDACEQSGTLPPLRMLTATDGQVVAESKPEEAKPKALPRAEENVDFGAALGGKDVGVALVTLAPGKAAAAGTMYLVLSGELVATVEGTTIAASARSLVPANATLLNSSAGNAELLAIKPR